MAFPFQKATAGAWFEGRVRKSCVLISWYSTSDANILVPDVWISVVVSKKPDLQPNLRRKKCKNHKFGRVQKKWQPP